MGQTGFSKPWCFFHFAVYYIDRYFRYIVKFEDLLTPPLSVNIRFKPNHCRYPGHLSAKCGTFTHVYNKI